MSGAMSLTGTGNEPTRMGIAMGDLAGGMYAAFAMAAALFRRATTGEGACIDISLLDALTALLTYNAQYYFHDGIVPGPQGTAHMSVVPYQSFKTRDGHLVVAAFTEKFWQALCRALELPELIADPRFQSNDARREHKNDLVPILIARFGERTTDEWMLRLEQEGVPSGPINSLDRVLCDPQILARQMKLELDHPKIGKLPMVGNPVKVEGVPEDYAPPPLLGQHTQEILQGLLGYTADHIEELKREGAI
jgi:crotonobetainyl-CoA:carnitine CoA-transferase CaiB-like acyl-CoA transferase